MPSPISILSTQNPIVKRAMKLHRMSERDSRGEFLFEGTHPLQEAVEAAWALRAVYFTQNWFDRNRALAQRVEAISVNYLVSDEILDKLSTTQTPDGVVAVASSQPTSEIPSDYRLGIAVDALQDPGNLGSLLRSCVACGADALFVGSGSVAVHHPKVIRSTAGQWFRRPPVSVDLGTMIPSAKENGIRVLAAVAGGEPIWDVDFQRPSLVLLGNEGAGLRPEWIDQADQRIGVPMAFGVESLNVAMTGSMILYEAMRQRIQGSSRS
ncbi:MAG: RNA methyltransferase [Planctomycetota bacterium]|jgi:TrmH family RNA methyltransferase